MSCESCGVGKSVEEETEQWVPGFGAGGRVASLMRAQFAFGRMEGSGDGVMVMAAQHWG